MKPTMQRIAELTGVSRGTVDRALHRRGRVDPEVEARVLRAAREIGYPLDRPARTVRSPEKPARRRIRIGVITYLCKAGFMQQINRGIARASEELQQWGVEVLLRESPALDEDEQPIDLFGGQEDLKNHIIRTVGDPAARFREDGLRILRGLRFASRLDFEIEPRTARAMIEERALLNSISAERIFTELKGILVGQAAGRVLRAFAPVLFTILPELAPMAGFEQHSPYHDSDVWEHTLRAFEASPPDPVFRLALLFHDCGKPACFFRDENGRGHFYGHPQKSRELAEGALRRLKCDSATMERALYLIEKHDTWLPETEKNMRRLVMQAGEARLRDLLTVQRCDALAHAPLGRDPALRNIEKWEQLLETVLQDTPCLSLQSLALSGDDLLSLGMAPGPRMGQLLNHILELVADGDLANEKPALLAYAKKHI